MDRIYVFEIKSLHCIGSIRLYFILLNNGVWEYVCTAMHNFSSSFEVLSWNNSVEVGDAHGHTRFECIFSKRPHPRSKGHPEVKLLTKCPMAIKFGKRNACWGQRSYRGQPGVELLRNASFLSNLRHSFWVWVTWKNYRGGELVTW